MFASCNTRKQKQTSGQRWATLELFGAAEIFVTV
jgi:hypothetical protein